MSDQSGTELVMGRSEERADLIAYLRRRLANATTMAKRTPDSDPDFTIYRDRQRQLQVMADEVSHGLHVGEVAVAAALALGGGDRWHRAPTSSGRLTMAFEDIDCVNPVNHFDAVPPKGVRLRLGKMTRKGGGDPTRYIRLTIGKDLARAASLTLPVHKLRLLFGTGDDAGKIMVAVDQEKGRFSAKRAKSGDYALTINAASAEGLFALEFPVFCVIDVKVERAPHCPVSFAFEVSGEMLAVAD